MMNVYIRGFVDIVEYFYKIHTTYIDMLSDGIKCNENSQKSEVADHEVTVLLGLHINRIKVCFTITLKNRQEGAFSIIVKYYKE